jgi:hypothetical protein
MRRRGLFGDKPKLQVIDNPVHGGILRDESDDLHRPAAFVIGVLYTLTVIGLASMNTKITFPA